MYVHLMYRILLLSPSKFAMNDVLTSEMKGTEEKTSTTEE